MTDAPQDRAARILLADDDPAMRDLLGRILREEGHEVTVVEDGLSAIARLDQPFEMILTDMRMPRADGLEVLRMASQRQPATPVVVITAFGSIPGAVDAMKLGAFDYLAKPLPDPQALRDVTRRALERRAATPSTEADPAPAAAPPGEVRVIAEDPAMHVTIEAAEKVAAHGDTTVLLLGESGTGKEVLANLIHARSPRASGPFVGVNCAALSETLLESELFGHEKGAFTDATSRHEGRFAQADGGTLFLDEIGETSPGLQAKLLRVLQEKTFQRVGGEGSITADVRVLAATNRDLQQAVTAGGFREDLYYRLAVFPIEIPPLRERPADVLPLAEHFLRVLTRAPDRTPVELDDGARRALASHDWPGNVRELQNVIERSLILVGSGPITAEALALGKIAAPGATAAQSGGTLKDMERRAIEKALDAEGGNRKRAAKRLGIALRTLQYKIKEYALSDGNK